MPPLPYSTVTDVSERAQQGSGAEGMAGLHRHRPGAARVLCCPATASTKICRSFRAGLSPVAGVPAGDEKRRRETRRLLAVTLVLLAAMALAGCKMNIDMTTVVQQGGETDQEMLIKGVPHDHPGKGKRRLVRGASLHYRRDGSGDQGDGGGDGEDGGPDVQ